MTTITLFQFGEMPEIGEICHKINGKKQADRWITARPGKYNRNEVFITYWYYEDIESSINKVMDENDTSEIVGILKERGKERILRRIYCYVYLLTRTLEVYTGNNRAHEIAVALEQLLGVKFTPLSMKSEDLQNIYSRHSLELKQAMFKNIHGLMYEILRGRFLDNNERFRQYLAAFPDCLKVISFRPKIKFLNGSEKYQVTVNADKGTMKISSNGVFKYRPRFEIRQLTFLVAATLGLLR